MELEGISSFKTSNTLPGLIKKDNHIGQSIHHGVVFQGNYQDICARIYLYLSINLSMYSYTHTHILCCSGGVVMCFHVPELLILLCLQFRTQLQWCWHNSVVTHYPHYEL